MVLNVHRNLLRTWRRGRGDGIEVGEEEDYILHNHHQNDSCIKMGSDESHFNVSILFFLLKFLSHFSSFLTV